MGRQLQENMEKKKNCYDVAIIDAAWKEINRLEKELLKAITEGLKILRHTKGIEIEIVKDYDTFISCPKTPRYNAETLVRIRRDNGELVGEIYLCEGEVMHYHNMPYVELYGVRIERRDVCPFFEALSIKPAWAIIAEKVYSDSQVIGYSGGRSTRVLGPIYNETRVIKVE